MKTNRRPPFPLTQWTGMLPGILLIAVCLSFQCLFSSCSDSSEPSYNHIAIEETDTPEQIIWKAAHVVPSRRQFEWQRLELTAFAHFGLNTFAEKQWG
ncbi:MAG: hypothetical protein ACI3ZN_00350, partial [Candidatus Cryptobacteroides sp.]